MFVLLQRVLPKKLIGKLVYAAVRWRFAPFKNILIGWFADHYSINMSEAAEPDLHAYQTFNAFFTRALKPGARPLAGDSSTVVAPADGSLTQWGETDRGALVQTKGIEYRVNDLLGADRPAAVDFSAGQFATIYLAPYNYHRVHMPVEGSLTEMTLLPGQRFSVNDRTVGSVANLFPGNERLVCWFETAVGPLAMVLVGAFNVATMSTAWHGEVKAPGNRPRRWPYEKNQYRYRRGDEIARFNLGSTVVMVLAERRLRWVDDLTAAGAIRMGEALGTRRDD